MSARALAIALLLASPVVQGCVEFKVAEKASETLDPAGPVISVSPGRVDLGEVPLGTETSVEISVSNLGEGELMLEELSLGGDVSWDLPASTGVVLPDEVLVVQLDFAASRVGDRDGTLFLASNDVATPLVSVPLTAVVIDVVEENLPPLAPVVAITPDPALQGVALTCTIVEPAADPEGDEVSYRFGWTVDGSPWTGATANTAWEGDTIPVDQTLAHERWDCAATPNDGVQDGEIGRASIEIDPVRDDCGDGLVDDFEACDDGNRENGDGCDATCAVESGWVCEVLDFVARSEETFPSTLGHDAPGWNLSGGDRVLDQLTNAAPTVYVTNIPSTNVEITFDIGVHNTEDDDYLGWAMGVDEHITSDAASDYLLFVWKQTSQSWEGGYAYAGLTMLRVTGVPSSELEFWDFRGDVVSVVASASHLGRTGWRDNQDYTVTLRSDGTTVEVWVDGSLEFSEVGSWPTTGYFGFYDFSQRDARYALLDPLDETVCWPE